MFSSLASLTLAGRRLLTSVTMAVRTMASTLSDAPRWAADEPSLALIRCQVHGDGQESMPGENMRERTRKLLPRLGGSRRHSTTLPEPSTNRITAALGGVLGLVTTKLMVIPGRVLMVTTCSEAARAPSGSHRPIDIKIAASFFIT